MGPGPLPLSPPVPELFAEESIKGLEESIKGLIRRAEGEHKQHQARLGVHLAHHDLLCTMGKHRLLIKPNIFLLLLFFLPGDTSPTTEP